jgi:UDP-glucose 4-epimerase
MKYFVAGGAGFIGSSLINRLVQTEPDCKIIAYDNLSSTGNWRYLNFAILNGHVRATFQDIKDTEWLNFYMNNIDVVYHFASNPDISKAMTDPTIDFTEGTLLTQNILEAMRINKVKRIIYASGSGVYGDHGYTSLAEDFSPMIPASTYGASKLAGESLISAYCHMFDMKGVAYRFANVIGGKSTHGVIKDFIERLTKNPNYLKILGSGKQEKGYIYIDDVLNGIFLTQNTDKIFDVFNISPDTLIKVEQIADIIIEEMGLENVKLEHGDSFGGWKGDIPIVVMNSDKIKSYGWKCSMTTEEAVRKATREILKKGVYNG